MDRPTLTSIISTTYGAVAADINLPEGTGAFYQSVVDNTLRLLGVAEADLETYVIDPSKVVDALALADYFCCEGFLRHLATAVDIQAYTPAVAKKRSQMFAQMRELRDDAAYKAALLGYPVVSSKGNNAFEMVRLTLDYLEPDPGGF